MALTLMKYTPVRLVIFRPASIRLSVSIMFEWRCDMESGPFSNRLPNQTKSLFELKDLCWGGSEGQ